MKKRIRLKKVRSFKILKRDKILLIILSILTLTFVINYYFDKKSKDAVLEFAINETTLLANYIINDAVKKNSFLFEDGSEFVNEIKDNEGHIISIDFNTVNVNKSLYTINENILENLKKIENGELSTFNYKTNLKLLKNNGSVIYFIPFGIVSNNIFLTALGPKIPIKMNPIGRVESKINTKLEEYGINNSLFSLGINVEVTQLVLLPFISEKVVINVEVPLIVKMIEGKIPSVYGGLLTNSSSLNTLNVE